MTYNLLLVDDEIHVLEGLKSDLDLHKLQINELFIANNAIQAKKILENENIHIMLCDIEMPQESGLELLSWLNDKKLNTITVFLTSHADFSYAKEALRLGSMDYLLKPVLTDELEEVIRKAQQEVDRNSELRDITTSHHLWTKHHSLIIERFWLDLINHKIPSHKAAIQEHIGLLQLPATNNVSFLPILIVVQRWNKDLNRRDEKIMEFALKNSAEELLLNNEHRGILLYLDKGMLLGILTKTGNQPFHLDQIKKLCDQYVESCNQYFYCDISCYIGQPVEDHQMAAMVMSLREQNRNNVVFYNKIFIPNEMRNNSITIQLPEISFWISLFKKGIKEYVVHEVEKMINEHVRLQSINITVLRQMHQDLIQALYAYLNAEGVQAYQLFRDEHSNMLSQMADRTVQDLLKWVHHVVEKAMNQAAAVNKAEMVVQFVKQYIAEHIDDELNRELLAEKVYMNPDHLTRIFKKETGFGISEYIITERVNIAKELLSHSDVPISTIAMSVGHLNFSYFSRIFKKYVGVGPTEYRAQTAKKKKSES